jgi:hypothetical protein
MSLEQWILQEFDEMSARLQGQVLAVVPVERRHERPGGGNSITWATFHVARHADLALAIIGGGEPLRGGGFGLGEVEHAGVDPLDALDVERYVSEVIAAGREFVSTLDAEQVERIPDASGTLERADVSRGEFPWLYGQWSGQPVAFFLRWPLIAHATNHIGEMIATRNRMGLSPHSS